jgi:predicted nucleotidyltransferase
MGSYRSAIIARHAHEQETRKSSMRAEAERLAAAVADRFAFTRLHLYGSAVDARPVSVWSDLDFAVEGLPPELLLDLAGALAALTTMEVDLKPLEELPAETRQHIERQGLVLHGRR